MLFPMIYILYKCLSPLVVAYLLRVLGLKVQPPTGKRKDFLIGICCLSSKPAPFRSKDWSAWSQNNLSKECDMSPWGLFPCSKFDSVLTCYLEYVCAICHWKLNNHQSVNFRWMVCNALKNGPDCFSGCFMN